jgi:CheY-like chemotaxis protein
MTTGLNCIMLVDDSEMDNYFHSEIIRRSGAAEEILVAENGPQALEIMSSGRSKRPDLIFLDINMPGMNGWEFLEAYQKLDSDQKARTVIIMLSTSLNPADKQRAQELKGISGYRSKPLSKAMLEEIISEFFTENKL